MNRERRRLLFGCFIFIDLLLIGGFFLIRDVTLKVKLNNEVMALNQVDFTNGVFNEKIESKGRYALVERAIKSYIEDYSAEVQKIVSYKDDSILDDLTSAFNYKLDGPEYIDSLKYIDYYQNKFNNAVDEVINNTNEENIYNYITEYTNDDFNIEMYKEVINKNNLARKVLDNKLFLLDIKSKYNNCFDVLKSLFNYLSSNKDKFYIDGDSITFIDDSVRVGYENILRQIKRID